MKCATPRAIIARPSINVFASLASFAPIGAASAAAPRSGRRSKVSSSSWTGFRRASLPDLRFQVEDAFATPNSAVPQLTFKVRVTNAEPEPIHSIALRAQIQIEPTRRRYTAAEQARLKEL